MNISCFGMQERVDLGVIAFEDGRVKQTLEVLPRQPLLRYWDGVVTGIQNDFNVN